MTSAKALFLRAVPGEKSLADWWMGVIHDAHFNAVLTCCRAHIMENQPTQEQVRGVEMALETLMTLAENEPDDSGYLPAPGLQHRLHSP